MSKIQKAAEWKSSWLETGLTVSEVFSSSCKVPYGCRFSCSGEKLTPNRAQGILRTATKIARSVNVFCQPLLAINPDKIGLMIPWKTEVIAQHNPIAKPALSANQLLIKIPTGTNDINETAIPTTTAIKKNHQTLVKCGINNKLITMAILETV